MAAFELVTFQDIFRAILEEAKIQEGDTVSLNRVKRDINIVYQELSSRGRFRWLHRNIRIQHDATIKAGTITATQNSKAIVFSSAPGISVEGYNFAVDGQTDIHTIETHTAGATAATLSNSYNGSTTSNGNYKLWQQSCPLPSDCKEVTEVVQNFRNTPLKTVGIQEFRRIAVIQPKAENRPIYYSVDDYTEADLYDDITSMPASTSRSSAGLLRTIVFNATVPAGVVAGLHMRITAAGDSDYDGNYIVASISTTTATNDTITYVTTKAIQEVSIADTGINMQELGTRSRAEQFRQMLLYPAIHTSNTILHVDYLRTVVPLEDDTDEPFVPVEDRIVLVYGALHRAWTRERNPEEATRNFQLFEKKASDMEGRTNDALDKPRFLPDKLYLSSLRNSVRQRGVSPHETTFGGAGSSGQVVTGTANTVATFGSDGNLIGSTKITVTELEQLDGILSAVVGISDTQTLTNKTIDGDNNTISNLAHGAEVDDLASGVHGVTGSVVGTSDTQTLTNKTFDGNNNTLTVLAATQLSGATPIANGGTGQITQTPAFDALAPTTTKGDIIAHNGTDNLRLAVGADDLVLTADSAEATGLKWNSSVVVEEGDQFILANQIFS